MLANVQSLSTDIGRTIVTDDEPLARLCVGDISVDPRTRTVRRGDLPVVLRPKEFELLVALMRRAGDVLGRRELLHDVWRYSDSVTSRTVDTHIAELRRKLAHAAGQPGHIATVARTGYRLEV